MARPSSYKKEYAAKAKALCLLGATDKEMAGIFGVSEVTFNAWKKKHPTFLNALKAGKEEADSEVATSLYQRALKGNVTACIFWLKNRRPDLWRDKDETEHSGKVDNKLEIFIKRAIIEGEAQ